MDSHTLTRQHANTEFFHLKRREEKKKKPPVDMHVCVHWGHVCVRYFHEVGHCRLQEQIHSAPEMWDVSRVSQYSRFTCLIIHFSCVLLFIGRSPCFLEKVDELPRLQGFVFCFSLQCDLKAMNKISPPPKKCLTLSLEANSSFVSVLVRAFILNFSSFSVRGHLLGFSLSVCPRFNVCLFSRFQT